MGLGFGVADKASISVRVNAMVIGMGSLRVGALRVEVELVGSSVAKVMLVRVMLVRVMIVMVTILTATRGGHLRRTVDHRRKRVRRRRFRSW